MARPVVVHGAWFEDDYRRSAMTDLYKMSDGVTEEPFELSRCSVMMWSTAGARTK